MEGGCLKNDILHCTPFLQQCVGPRKIQIFHITAAANVWFQEYPHSPNRNSKGGGNFTAKLSKKSTKLNWNFQRGGEDGAEENNLPMMTVFFCRVWSSCIR